MTNSRNIGICFLCNKEVSYRSIKKHLAQCVDILSPEKHSGKSEIFLIKVFAGKYFWLYIEINGNESLGVLDTFLRETWLECCGHLSQFTINGEDCSNNSSMKKTIQQTLDKGTKFSYEYDFGDTTELEGEVISIRPGKLNSHLRLIARNCLPEEIVCSRCTKRPEHICSVCYEFFCDKCVNQHKNCDGEEYMLPVVNSPRMGVCGYTGPE